LEGEHLIDRSLCTLTGACTEACNYNALELTGKMMTAGEVMEVVKKDRAYYDTSGGGITISGGEPMMQFEFLKEILEIARKEKIHTCVDTSGYAPTAKFKEILALTDLFLYDIKASDPGIHMAITGVNNELIWQNFLFLYESKAMIEVRLPLVPGVNDHPEHLEKMRELRNSYPDLKGVRIMPYHNIGESKAIRYAYNSSTGQLKNVDNTLLEKWNSIIGINKKNKQ
jgi:glycyl-radical enzyme activating protein